MKSKSEYDLFMVNIAALCTDKQYNEARNMVLQAGLDESESNFFLKFICSVEHRNEQSLKVDK